MAETFEQLEAQRLALVRAMRSGALNVRHGDKSVQYRSMAEMQTALDMLDEDIAEASGKKKKRIIYVSASRGY